jgi:hypothetical protein
VSTLLRLKSNIVANMESRADDGRETAIARAILLVATFLEVAVMGHHPSVQASDPLGAAREMVALSATAVTVHGVLVALMLVIAYGCAVFASGRGASRPLIGIGSIFYGAGVVVMIGAALVSGFVLPDLANALPHATAGDGPGLNSIFILCRVLNRTCANFGVVAMSVGIGCWSLDLLKTPGLKRAVGAWGCVVSILAPLAIFSRWIHLDVHGMTQVIVLQASWYISMAFILGS